MSERTRIRGRLSPDLVPVFEQAEKFFDEGLHRRASLLYRKILQFLPGDLELEERLRAAEAGLKSGQGPAAEFGDGIENDPSLSSLARELGVSELLQGDSPSVSLSGDVAAFLELAPENLKRTALDVAVFLGLSGDWETSLVFAERLQAAGDERSEVKLWRLRCLVELERASEGVAMSGVTTWPAPLLIHVNYLVGICYESLGVRDQARLRFESVQRQDPTYGKVAQKLLNY